MRKVRLEWLPIAGGGAQSALGGPEKEDGGFSVQNYTEQESRTLLLF